MKENQSKDVEIPQKKPKPRKLTKEDKEHEVIAEFESDEKDIFEARKNCGLNLADFKCNKCSFETHSEGTIKKHKRTAHQIKESNENIILGFKNDIFHHFKLIEAVGELNKVRCRTCDYKTNSRCELKMHVHEQHNIL